VQGAAQQPVPGDRVVEAQQPFADAVGVGVEDAVADVVAQRPDVGDVVVAAFQFQQHRPDAVRAVRDAQAAGVLDGTAEGQGVPDGGVPADAFGQLDRLPRVAAGEEFFDSFVDEPEPGLEVENGLADHGEPEVAGFDQAGMHRADRDLVHPGALHRPEGIGPVDVPERGRVTGVGQHRVPAAGQWKCRTRRRGSGWWSGTMPYRSCISRSNRPAVKDNPARLARAGGPVQRDVQFDAAVRVGGGEQVHRT